MAVIRWFRAMLDSQPFLPFGFISGPLGIWIVIYPACLLKKEMLSLDDIADG